MITFDLICGNGHSFEGWFDSRSDFESQCKKRLIACPQCNDTNVSRTLSTFAVKTPPNSGASEQNQMVMAKAMQEMSRIIENKFDDVGTNFAKEALKMHYGVTEARNIRGTSSPEEEKTLKNEGVDFFKFPLIGPPESDSEDTT
jgi:hypothetical protein